MHQPTPAGAPTAGPPLGGMPAVVAVGSVFGRSDQAVVALTEVHAYASGCLFHFLGAAARPDPSRPPWGHTDQGAAVFAHINGHTDELLILAMEDAAGARVSTVASTPAPPTPPQGRAWVNFEGCGQVDRAGTRLAYRQPVWLSPLPTSGALWLCADWPAYGITDARLELETAPLIQAAATAVQFWPEL